MEGVFIVEPELLIDIAEVSRDTDGRLLTNGEPSGSGCPS
jgi:hypothetical protein